MEARFKRGTVAFVVMALIVMGPVSASASSDSATPTDSALSAKDRVFIHFAETHPGDYAAQDRLAQQLFGNRLYVQFEGLGEEVTGIQASEMIAAAQASPHANPKANAGGEISTLSSLPVDVFSVSISRTSITAGMWVAGHTAFRSDWAGQADPHDVGTLQFSAPSCITLNSHAIATSPKVGLGYLYDAKVSQKTPIWKVNDYMNAFVMQAKNITASVVLKKVSCAGSQSISAAWRYEANQSGSISSISASFGSLNVGYTGAPLTLQKSSSVMNFPY